MKHFGQATTPNNPIARLRKQFLAENGDTKPFTDLLRSLNNVPIEAPMIAPARIARRWLARLDCWATCSRAGC